MSEVCAHISFSMQVTEQYSFARQTSMARRDLRSGQQTAQARLDAEGVRLSITWGAPNAGRDLLPSIL